MHICLENPRGGSIHPTIVFSQHRVKGRNNQSESASQGIFLNEKRNPVLLQAPAFIENICFTFFLLFYRSLHFVVSKCNCYDGFVLRVAHFIVVDTIFLFRRHNFTSICLTLGRISISKPHRGTRKGCEVIFASVGFSESSVYGGNKRTHNSNTKSTERLGEFEINKIKRALACESGFHNFEIFPTVFSNVNMHTVFYHFRFILLH